MSTASTVIRLRGCAGSPESSCRRTCLFSAVLIVGVPFPFGVEFDCIGSISLPFYLLSFSFFFTPLSNAIFCLIKWSLSPAKTQFSLDIRPVWSYPSLCAQWAAKDSRFLHGDSNFDQTELEACPGWSESSLSVHVILLVLSCGGSVNISIGMIIQIK